MHHIFYNMGIKLLIFNVLPPDKVVYLNIFDYSNNMNNIVSPLIVTTSFPTRVRIPNVHSIHSVF